MNKTNLTLIAVALTIAELSFASGREREKAKFDLISSIEQMVNIDECRKQIKENKDDLDDLPRACNSLPTLSKYFFNKEAKLHEVMKYLDNEEGRVTESAMSLVNKYRFDSLGKMILSPKCVINNRPVDLDIYLNRLKGIPLPQEKNEATELEAKFEEDIERKKHSQNKLIPMETPERRDPARTPDAIEPVKEEPKGEFEKEFAAFEAG